MSTEPAPTPADLSTNVTASAAGSLGTAIEQMTNLREKSWARMGRLLLDIEQTGYWEEQGSSSFGEYVALLAERLNVDPSVLWRNRKAVEFYETELRELIQSSEGTLPALNEKPPKIGPEGLSFSSVSAGLRRKRCISISPRSRFSGTSHATNFATRGTR